jgi:flagellar hook protein FlgE
MSVTGNNISNSNTVGFKSSSTVFADLLSATISSSSGDSQVGRGTQVQSVKSSFSQGGFENTESTTDLAIDGSGFFVVSDPANETQLYTRNGSFNFDTQGYLISAEGYRLQGSLYNSAGNLVSGSLADIQIDSVSQLGAQATSEVTLQTNLDSNSDILTAFDIADSVNTSNYSTTTSVYDSLGTAHLATTYFTKTDDQTWSWNVGVDSDDLLAGGTDDLTVIAGGTLTFDANGELLTGQTGITDALAWANGSDTSQSIVYSFDTTQYDSESTVFYQDQDGYTSGEVSSVDIDNDGIVSATYSNGITTKVAKITLATFANVDGLSAAGGSLFSSTLSSGTAIIGYPGDSQGTLSVQSLELSNVDLSAEMVDLITIQSGYNANSKVIVTTNEMLEEVLSMKR